LDITSFNSNKCSNFNEMFTDCKNLNLTLNRKNCQNLIDSIPNYVNIIDG
jgi:hypothetical protein